MAEHGHRVSMCHGRGDLMSASRKPLWRLSKALETVGVKVNLEFVSGAGQQRFSTRPGGCHGSRDRSVPRNAEMSLDGSQWSTEHSTRFGWNLQFLRQGVWICVRRSDVGLDAWSQTCGAGRASCRRPPLRRQPGAPSKCWARTHYVSNQAMRPWTTHSARHALDVRGVTACRRGTASSSQEGGSVGNSSKGNRLLQRGVLRRSSGKKKVLSGVHSGSKDQQGKYLQAVDERAGKGSPGRGTEVWRPLKGKEWVAVKPGTRFFQQLPNPLPVLPGRTLLPTAL